MARHSAAAKRLLSALDNEPAETGLHRGQQLSWTTKESEMREILAKTVDRRARVEKLCAAATDGKLIVKLSTELRQLDNTVTKLLKEIRTDVPEPESLTTIKARRAVNTRWQRERERDATG